MKIVLTGGTGFIGRALVDRLIREGHHVVVLSRRPEKQKRKGNPKATYLSWDGNSIEPWANDVDGSDAVINLAGDPIASGRWTMAKKKRIRDSRVQATRAIVFSINNAKKKPHVLINASAVGIYGTDHGQEFTEESPKGQGYLSDVCFDWENEASKLSSNQTRVVLLRIGVVLGKGGGALQKMIPPFFLYAGGPLGNGQQWFPWIHRDDIIGAILFALHHRKVRGPLNLTAPESINNHDFSKSLGKAMSRPSWAPVPAFMLKLLLGEMSGLLLGSQKVIPTKLQDFGYKFKYPTVDRALKSILGKN